VCSCGTTLFGPQGYRVPSMASPLLHISDLHIDINEGAMRRLEQLLPGLEYDVCVLTGDYRGKTFGPFDVALEGMKRLRTHLGKAVYGVLGNHDTIRMVPDLEEMDIRILLNESKPIARAEDRIYLAGIDDAHHYRLDDIERATTNIPSDAFSILLSHTPEVYHRAANARFDLLLSGRGALYSVTRSKVASSESNTAKCVVCSKIMDRWDTTDVPTFKLIHRPDDD